MKIKTNLHFHTSDDPEDVIDYDFYEGVNRAVELGFGAIALTCHNKFASLPAYESYASKQGILLIPGIEREIGGKHHVVILNCDRSAEFLNTFEDLARYRKDHPEIFVIAPHPYFKYYSLGKKLDRNASLFDAVEHSWFYSDRVNFNKKAEMTATRENMPFFATSDTHFLELLDKCYAVVNTEEKTPAGIFRAIRGKKFENVTAPAKFWREMIYYFVLGEIKKVLPRKRD